VDVRKGHRRRRISNVLKILKALKQADAPLTVSKIAKMTGLHKWTVSRTIDLHMSAYVSVTVLHELEEMGVSLKLVQLERPDVTPQQAVRLLSVRFL